jgi:hypothetical protein
VSLKRRQISEEGFGAGETGLQAAGSNLRLVLECSALAASLRQRRKTESTSASAYMKEPEMDLDGGTWASRRRGKFFNPGGMVVCVGAAAARHL